MVKGISRRIVVVEAPDQNFFEQAIFIVRNDAAGEGVTTRDLVEEARRVTRSYARGESEPKSPPRRRWTSAIYTAVGAAGIALGWLAATLF